MRKRKIAPIGLGALVFAALCLFATGMAVFAWKAEIPKHERALVASIRPRREFEDVGNKNEEIVELTMVDREKEKKAKEKKEELKAKEEPSSNNRFKGEPNLIQIRGKYYYLFDGDVLLPLTIDVWKENQIPAKGDYGATSEFYADGETPRRWSQKFAIHEVKTADEDCFEFVDKIVNGIIITIDDQMVADGKELEPENLLFSFVRKEKDNTVLFWRREKIPSLDDEVQFLRCFRVPYSGKMYLTTFTLKATQDSLADDEIAGYVKVLENVIELRERKVES